MAEKNLVAFVLQVQNFKLKKLQIGDSLNWPLMVTPQPRTTKRKMKQH